MGKVRILVVEDEIIIADNICEALEDLGYEVSEPAITYSEAIETIQEFQPDLAILDIQLSGKKDGIDIAQNIKANYNIPFIFLTSNSDSQTVGRAKEVSPSAYLVKPFSKDELYTSIEIALSNFNQNKEHLSTIKHNKQNALFIKQKNLFIKVEFDDILYVKSDHVYVEIFTKGGKTFLVRGSLNEYITKLGTYFIRVHRGYAVNIKHVDAFEQELVMIGKECIPLSKTYRDGFIQQLNIS